MSTLGDELFLSEAENLFRTTFDGATFQTAVPIAEINGPCAQGFPSISGDGLDLYFETTRSDAPKSPAMA